MSGPLHDDSAVLAQHIREGRFQRSLSLVAALAGALSGLEVTYEHYRGSYNQQIMYTPVLLSLGLTAAGVSGAVSRRAARTVLPAASALTVIDGAIGFYFHVRGVARKPGGWRVPVMNTIMGPPVFAPLLFSLSGYLGLIASQLRREESPVLDLVPGIGPGGHPLLSLLPRRVSKEGIVLEQHVREGRFQKHLAAVAGVSALLSSAEALYSHYQNNFSCRALQGSPLVLGPLLTVAGLGTIWSKRVSRTLLPLASALALLDGTVGFIVHARGVMRRPGGLKLPIYNIMYGPPIFAPLLFAAGGFMGLLASLLRRAD